MRLLVVLALILSACHHDTDPTPMQPRPGELPPLPPSSGTPVGYLIDNAGDLHLRDDQVNKLKDIDTSLAAQQAEIDTQLRAIERPDKDLEKEEAEEHKRHNNAPGQGITTNPDAGRLHQLHDRNDQDALGRAFVVLSPEQQATARRILEERGVHAPGSKLDHSQPDAADGTPLPVGEP